MFRRKFFFSFFCPFFIFQSSWFEVKQWINDWQQQSIFVYTYIYLDQKTYYWMIRWIFVLPISAWHHCKLKVVSSKPVAVHHIMVRRFFSRKTCLISFFSLSVFLACPEVIKVIAKNLIVKCETLIIHLGWEIWWPKSWCLVVRCDSLCITRGM